MARQSRGARARAAKRSEYLDLSRGSWGWNEAQTVWVPRFYAEPGELPVAVLRDYRPIPPVERLFESRARFLSALSCRRGGKTYNIVRVFIDRALEVSELVRTLGDGVVGPADFDQWFENTVGRPGAPKVLRHRLLKKSKAPCPFWVVSPTYELGEQVENELSDELLPWEDELGVVWKGRTLWILALGIRIDIKSGENPKRLVSRGLCGVLLDEAARLKPLVFTNVLPTVNDRRGFVLSATTTDGKNAFFSEIWARGDEAAAKEVGRPERFEPAVEPEEPELGRWVEGAINVDWGAEENTFLPHLVAERDADIRRYGEDSLHVLQTWERSFESPHGKIWKLLRAKTHVRTMSETNFVAVVAGFDPGYGSNAALLFFGRTARGGWHLYKAKQAEGLLPFPPAGSPLMGSASWGGIIAEEASRLRRNLDLSLVTFIGADRPDIRDQWIASGLDVRTAKTEVRPGILTVERAVAPNPDAPLAPDRVPKLSIDPDVPPDILGALTGYSWATTPDGRSLGYPLKDGIHDHVADGARYALHSSEVEGGVGAGGQIESYDFGSGL